jgi:ribosome-associated protein
MAQAQWVLLDYVDIVVHVFHKDARKFYAIEKIWGDAKIETVQDEVEVKAAKAAAKSATKAAAKPKAAPKPKAVAKSKAAAKAATKTPTKTVRLRKAQ